MSKKCLLFFYCFLILGFIQAQVELELNQLIIEKINAARSENQLHPLEEEEILNAVAFDQAEYIQKLGKIVHEQDNAKKKTLLSRILYYEGLYSEAGENAAIVGIGSKEAVVIGGERVEIKNNEMAVQAAVSSWLSSDEGKMNLLDPNFYKVGVATFIKDDSKLFFVFVGSSLPYENPTTKKAFVNFHGIEREREEECIQLLTEYSSIPQLLSDAVKVENGQFYLMYHDIEFIRTLLKGSLDAVAVDIIQHSQFNCESGNRLFPSEINDGYLMKPVGKSRLNMQNEAENPTEVKMNLGRVPSFYQEDNCELNLLLIKKGHYCETIPFNKVEVSNKRWFDLPFLLAGLTDTSIFNWKDSSTFNYQLDSALKFITNWKTDYDAISLFDYQLDDVTIHIKESPVNPVTIADSHLLDIMGLPEDVSISREQDWKEVDAYTKGTYYQLDLAELDEEKKGPFLLKSMASDEKLSKFLNGLNQLEVKLVGSATINANFTAEHGISLYKNMLANQKIQPALLFQSRLIQKVKDGELAADLIPLVDQSQKRKTLSLINNQLALKQILGENEYDGNPIHLAFLELHLIDKSQAVVSFNYHISQLEYWSKNMGKIKNLEGWLKSFRLIGGNAAIPKEAYSRANFNYFLIAVDHYFESGNFDKRKKAFKELMKWSSRANLTEEEILDLAKYLCFQDQYPLAIKLLYPRVKKEEVNNELFTYFLQIASYDNSVVTREEYAELTEKLANTNAKQFCALFSKEKMGRQVLKNSAVKSIYCAKCK